jgi:hypothetical protein
MNMQATITQKVRVTFMAMDATTPFNSRSTKWYNSIDEVPAKYLATVGVKYDSEAPCLWHSGEVETRAAHSIFYKA